MKRNEEGEWLRVEPRPDLALEDEAPEPPRRRPRPAPGKVTRTLSLPAASPARVKAARTHASADRSDVDGANPQDAPAPASATDPFPDVFGGALSPQRAPVPATTTVSAAQGDGELAAAKAAVDRAFAAQRDAILTAAAQQGPALQQAAAAAHAQVIGEIGSRESTIRATFSQARHALRNAERTQIALARSDAAAVGRRFRAATSVRKAYGNAADTEADRVTSTIHADGALITASANSIYTKLDAARGDALKNAELPLQGADGEVINDSLDRSRVAPQRRSTRGRSCGAALGRCRRDLLDRGHARVHDLLRSRAADRSARIRRA